MKTKGQFMLFTVPEFDEWLRNTQFSRPVRTIQNHHTWSPRYGDFTGSNHFALAEGMRKHHVNNNGWADIGQNVTTYPDGTVMVCRSFEKAPACILGQNAGAVCLEHLGNFDTGRDAMTAEHRDAIIQVNALLCREFTLPVNTTAIVYHHWFDLSTGKRHDGAREPNKTCPGSGFFGGNKVADARAHFLPLVKDALAGAAVFTVKSPDGVLTVRDRPSGTGDPVAELSNGDTVQVFDAKGIWRRIDEEQERWVSSKFLVKS